MNKIVFKAQNKKVEHKNIYVCNIVARTATIFLYIFCPSVIVISTF